MWSSSEDQALSHTTLGSQTALSQASGDRRLRRQPAHPPRRRRPGSSPPDGRHPLEPAPAVAPTRRVAQSAGLRSGRRCVSSPASRCRVVVDEHDRLRSCPNRRPQDPAPRVRVDPETRWCPRRLGGAPGDDIQRRGHDPGGSFLDIPAPDPVDQALHTRKHHLERDSSGQGVVGGSLEESGENLIPLRPTRSIPPLRCRHELVAVIERQPLVVGGPVAEGDLAASRDRASIRHSASSRRINSVCAALAGGLGPMEASSRCVHERKRPREPCQQSVSNPVSRVSAAPVRRSCVHSGEIGDRSFRTHV